MNDEMVVKRTVCQFCHARCRVEVHSKNGHLVKIEPDKTFPRWDVVFPSISDCMRVKGAKEFMEHPDRLNFPLKRVGEKGEGKWQKIPWEQALDEVAAKLTKIKEQYGAEAIGASTGTGRSWYKFMTRFLHLLGSPNQGGASAICHGPAVVVANALLGWAVRHRTGVTIDSLGGKLVTKCVMLIGINPSQAYPRLWKSIREGKKLGVKVILMDPRATMVTELTDLHLQHRPGTDTPLLLSIINVLIEKGLYDKEFVDKWCYGFDKVAERAREYPPEKVAEITWVPANKIREAAMMFGQNRPAQIVHGMGMEHLQDATGAIQARFILSALNGTIDAPGGDYMPGPSKLRGAPEEEELVGMLSPAQKAKQLGSDRFKLMAWPGRDLIQSYTRKVWGRECSEVGLTCDAHMPTLYRAMITGKPYPVKAFFTVFSNPMVTQANTKLVYKALKSLDLYVVHDYWRTPSAELADYVFPCACWMERPWLWDQYNEDNDIYAAEAGLPSTIPGEYEHRTGYEFFRGLGIRMGQEKHWPWKNLEEVFEWKIEPLGTTFKEFMDKGGYYFPPPDYKKYERQGFATPTGKCELYSTIYEKLGYDPLPHYKEPFETLKSRPDLAKEYPLMLITGGRFHPMFHSEHRQISSARERHPNPLVQINPQTAAKFGIEDGDWAWIETPRGRIRMKCQHLDGIDPRVVHVEHGWWFPELPGEEPWLHGVWESNANVLTEDDPDVCDKIHGGWPLKTGLCKVYKVKTYESKT